MRITSVENSRCLLYHRVNIYQGKELQRFGIKYRLEIMNTLDVLYIHPMLSFITSLILLRTGELHGVLINRHRSE